MFKQYRELQDVVSLIIYCTSDKSFLLLKEISGEYWIPSTKSEKNSWKMTAHNMLFELFGLESGTQWSPLRVCKVWLPAHSSPCVYHAIYKLTIRAEAKKRMKAKPSIRLRVQWVPEAELERLQAHCALRSPELLVLAKMIANDTIKDGEVADMEKGQLIEVGEESVIISTEAAGGAAGNTSPQCQLLAAANYSRDDQVRLFREFLTLNFPALYMSLNVFTLLMLDVGWQRSCCSNLFSVLSRSADVNNRGGLSFLELLLWCAASEPATQHSGLPAEMRCRYIFRYYDCDRDQKLQYLEFKDLVAAARSSRQLSVDALSVLRDVDLCYKQLGLQPNAQLSQSDFLRSVRELRIRGTSTLLRAPRSVLGYVIDLHERDCMEKVPVGKEAVYSDVVETAGISKRMSRAKSEKAGEEGEAVERAGYSLAACVVRLQRGAAPDVLRLDCYEEDAVSLSTIKMMSMSTTSFEVLGAGCSPVETLASVHYFASAVDTPALVKPAYTWAQPSELAALGAALLSLSEAVRSICEAEPRLLRLNSPVYIIGDLHGNLGALLAMEASLWASGAALLPAGLLFLGDFVDRGAWGVELVAYLFAAKLQRPRTLHLVRGNHETRDIQTMFTFFTECTTKFGEVEGTKIWNTINNVFDVLPLAAVVDGKVFCCHGGIPPPWVCPRVSGIARVPVPLPRPATQSHMAWELLWNDPVKPNKITASLALELSANEGFAANSRRGTGHVFDQRALDRFLLANGLTHVVRAHELHQNGFMCHLGGKLISVFSSSHYCGGNNDSGVVLLQDGKLRLIRIAD